MSNFSFSHLVLKILVWQTYKNQGLFGKGLITTSLTLIETKTTFNPLPDDKISGLPKLKAFAYDKLDVTQNIKVVFQRTENIMGNKEILVTSIFFFSHNVFKRLFAPVRQKSSLCGKKLSMHFMYVTFIGIRLSVLVLTLSKTTKFRLFQTQRVCRRQF